jgi:hypothetical protein
MPNIHIPPAWRLPDAAATPEPVYLDRRRFIAAAAGTLLLPALGCAEERRGPFTGVPKYPIKVPRNEKYKLDRKLTKDTVAASFNNYYEFTTDKERVWKISHALKTAPWSIEIAGHCKRTGKVDLDAILKLPQEERLYRFRCVETWAMTVPWIGVPMHRFLDWLEPTSKAKYVRFWTVWRPKVRPDEQVPRLAGADEQGQVRPLLDRLAAEDHARPVLPRHVPVLRGAAHGRGQKRADAARDGHVRPRAPHPERRAGPRHRAVEIRLQVTEVDRQDRVRREEAADLLERSATAGVRLS